MNNKYKCESIRLCRFLYSLGFDKESRFGENKNEYWVFEEDYISGNYKIPKEKPDKFIVSVDKYDMNDDYLKTYKTIYEAEIESVSNKSEIYRVASGNRKSSRNEKWKFSKTA